MGDYHLTLGDSSTDFLYPATANKTISMEFKGADLNDVLRIFSNQSGLNFIAGQEAGDKKVTLYLKNVPVEEALERILTANNLTYEMQPNSDIFIVKPLLKQAKELVTRVYPLKYATVASSKLNQTIQISQGGSGSSSSGSSSGGSSASGGSSGGSAGSSAGGSASGGAGDGIVNVLKGLLTESGKLVEDPRTNSLIITDIPNQFPTIERTLARLDVPIPQILIEVEMLDVSKSTSDLLGVKFGNTPLTFKGAQRDVTYPWDQGRLLDKGYHFVQSEYRVGTIDASGLSATLQFLKTQTDTKNLARPRIMTLNNETAEIKISTDEAIGAKTKTDTADTSATKTVEAERTQTGVFLRVTPQANPLTGEITMALVPKVIQARPGATFSGTTFKDPEERGTQSILKVLSGDTIILGGLMRTDAETTVTKVPLLGDIPFVGSAFRHKDKAQTQRELIIFITPHIVGDVGKINTPAKYGRINREQDVPTSYLRSQEVNRALSTMERQ